MNILDIILLLCFIPAIISGIRKGFIAQVVAILSLVLGAWLSYKFSASVSQWFSNLVETSPQVLHIISFIVIFVVVTLVLLLLGKVIEKVIKIIMLGWLNRLLGIVFSLVKAFLVVGLLIIVFNSLNDVFHFVSDSYLAESVLYNPLKKVAYTLFPYFKDLIVK